MIVVGYAFHHLKTWSGRDRPAMVQHHAVGSLVQIHDVISVPLAPVVLRTSRRDMSTPMFKDGSHLFVKQLVLVINFVLSFFLDAMLSRCSLEHLS